MSIDTKTAEPSTSSTTTTTSTSTSTSTTDDNVWSNLLKKAIRKNKENNSTLVVMGVPKSGKSSLLTKFSDRIIAENSNEYLLQYSYLLVKNKYAADKDDVLAHMNIWQLDDLQQLSILPLLLTGIPATSVTEIASTLANINKSTTHNETPTLATSTSNPALNDGVPHATNTPFTVSPEAATTLDNTIYVVVIDLSSPASIITELSQWLQGITLVTERMMSLLTTEQQQQMKQKISRHVQNYYAALSNSTPAGASGLTSPTDASTTTTTTLLPDIPAINLGIPVIIVGTKADTFTRKLNKPSANDATASVTTSNTGSDEKFEFITRRLRKMALQYGAGLIYTSSAGRGTSIDTLQSLLLHRLYHFPYPHAAKVVGSEDDWTIHIPSGADNQDLIDSVSSVPTKSGWDDNTPFETIFSSHKRRASTVISTSSASSANSVRALDNVLFFKNLKVQLEQGPTRRDEALRDLVQAQVKSSTRTSMDRQSSGSSALPASSPTNASSSASSASASASAAAKAKAAASKPKLNPKGQIAVKQFFRSLLTNNPKSDATKSAQKTVRANAEQAIASMAEGTEEPNEGTETGTGTATGTGTGTGGAADVEAEPETES